MFHLLINKIHLQVESATLAVEFGRNIKLVRSVIHNSYLDMKVAVSYELGLAE